MAWPGDVLLGNQMVTLRVFASVPSKKNSLRPRRGGGLMNDKTVAAQIDALAWMLSKEWKPRPTLDRCEVRARFFVNALRADDDNAYTVLQDCLVKAGVVRNDNRACIPAHAVSSEEIRGIEYFEVDIIPLEKLKTKAIRLRDRGF